MTLLAEVLSADLVFLDIDVRDARALFEFLGSRLAAVLGLPAETIAAGLEARESRGSTSLGKGVAIPHARLAGIVRPQAAIVRGTTPLDFTAPDDEPVAVFFALLMPAQTTDSHLSILADVAERFSSAKFRDDLKAVTAPSATVDLFVHWHDPLVSSPKKA